MVANSRHERRAYWTLGHLLASGKVLVIGGVATGNASAELYDPATGMWSFTDGMHRSRSGHTATLLSNNKVLVVAGSGPASGVGPIVLRPSAELYAPSAPAPTTIVLTGATRLAGGEFQFSFSNTPGANFTTLATTNVSLPLSNWAVLGPVPEISPGQFRFIDSQAGSHMSKFYRVRSP